MLNIIFIGVLFGFLGFLLESISSSIVKRQFVYSGDKLFWGIPFLPIYSSGGLLMHYLIVIFINTPSYLAILISWLGVCAWEYTIGVISHKIYKRRFWDYSKRKFNLNGHVCLINSIFWLLIVSIYYQYFFGLVDQFLSQ